MQTLRLALFPLILSFILTPGFSQNSILWEVSGNDLAHSSYLLGSLKFIGEKEYILHTEIKDKIKVSELFAIEDEVNHHAQHELNKAIHFELKYTNGVLFFDYADNGNDNQNKTIKPKLIDKICRQLEMGYKISTENGFSFSIEKKINND